MASRYFLEVASTPPSPRKGIPFGCGFAALCLLFTASLIFAHPRSEEEKVFATRLQEYVKMQKEMEGSGSPAAGNSTKDSEQITDRQKALGGRIAAARRTSRQGDIFTHDVAEQFEKIIRQAFKDPGGRAMRRTLDQEREPVKHIVLHVNDVYPENLPRATMPPTLLSRLPVLPKELAYRIIGRALVLEDIKANLIVDFLPNAIP